MAVLLDTEYEDLDDLSTVQAKCFVHKSLFLHHFVCFINFL